VRLVVGLLKGKNALKALEQLEFVIRRPSLPIAKLLRSAIANAEHNYSMVPSNLFIKEIYVDEGVKLKRFRPKARGAVGEIQKKTSHIRLTLSEKVPGLKSDKKAVKHDHDHDHDHAGHDHSHDEPASTAQRGEQPKMNKFEKPEIKTEIGKKGEATNTKRRTFQRKSI
jgi:large subunit ribosomal protein L22